MERKFFNHKILKLVLAYLQHTQKLKLAIAIQRTQYEATNSIKDYPKIFRLIIKSNKTAHIRAKP